MSYNNIFIEGIDGSGKSTLIEKIKQLEEYKNAIVIHATSKTANDLKWYMDRINSEEICIFDRAFLGDLVYNNPLRLSHKEFMSLALELTKDSLLILVTNDLDDSVDVLLERGEISVGESEEHKNILDINQRTFNVQFDMLLYISGGTNLIKHDKKDTFSKVLYYLKMK